MIEGNKLAFDTADNPTLASGVLSRTANDQPVVSADRTFGASQAKKTARAVFDKLVAEIH